MEADPDQALRRRIRSAWPLAHEWVVLAYIAVSIWFLERMPVTYPRTALFFAYVQPVLVIGAFAIAAAAIHRRIRGNQAEKVGDLTWSIGRLLLVLMFAWATHFLVKSFIFAINPRSFDLPLAALDQRLHFGLNTGAFFTTLFRAPLLLRSIDLFYSGIYYLVVVSYAGALLALLPLRLRMAFGAALALMWAVGAAIYVAMPTWGPVFVFSRDYTEALRHMPVTVSVQRVLFDEISSLVRHPNAVRYVRFGSVAAFPSLHVALVTLYALASRHLSRRWFQVNLAIVAVMVVGSVVTGYHYLVDAWAGILLSVGLWLVCVWWFSERNDATAVDSDGRSPE